MVEAGGLAQFRLALIRTNVRSAKHHYAARIRVSTMEAGPMAKPWIPEGHVEMHLKKAKDGKSENWLARSSSGWGDATNIIMHARPPLDVIGTVGRKAPALRAHGGLSPGAMR